jgi:hypothetical protein
MRRIACLAALLALAAPAHAQQAPHAFLFGAWTGGLFPAPAHVTARECLAHPTVIFTQDTVLRATLTDFAFVQRQVETVRVNGPSVEFRLVQAAQPAASGMLGTVAPPPAQGFGCESPDVLHVRRRGDNEISFPGCADFPNPLVRCPSG